MKDFPMPVPVSCPACGAKMIAHDSALGERRKCPKCGELIVLRSANVTTGAADTHPLDPGWVKVAVGYRLFEFACLFTLIGVFGTLAACVLAWAVYEQNQDTHNDSVRTVVGTAVGASFGILVMVFTCLGATHFLAVPSDEDGGRGKTLAAGMLAFSVVPCLSAGVLLVLPVFSAGVGNALGDRELFKCGWNLYLWFLAGFAVQVMTGLCAFGGDQLGIQHIGIIAGGVISTAGWLLVFLGVWNTFSTFRRGIEAAVRQRGLRGDGISDSDRPRTR